MPSRFFCENSLFWRLMAVKNLNARIILGLKARQLRQEQGLSFAELSKTSGLSVSYLNEIEKGKKFPKPDKLEALAKSLKVSVEQLSSDKLEGTLAPVSDLLQSNFLNELPLDLFGIDLSKIVEIISQAPKKVGAFISTLVEIARNHAYVEENFYYGALRSYLEMHLNYFEDIEQAVSSFRASYGFSATEPLNEDQLSNLLETNYHYDIEKGGLDQYTELAGIRSVYIPKSKTLLLNGRLRSIQRGFQYGKELGFNYLGLKQRANTASLMRVESFEMVLAHFKAAYFSAALIMPLDAVHIRLKEFLAKETFDTSYIQGIMHDFGATGEMVFQRMTNILPALMGIRKIYFFRFLSSGDSVNYTVDKELHLDGKHTPHANRLSETYCRRWLSIRMLDQLKKSGSDMEIGAQISKYHDSSEEYLIISLVKKGDRNAHNFVGLSLGILLEKSVKSKIGFLKDSTINRNVISTTCERCPIMDCAQRAADPIKYLEKEQKKRVYKALGDLLK